ncbi:MAG TPA: hypothetical protein VFN11_16440, partial [Ktedonobacterales bacterium]|nr:hypothetical protein [Ktedonobacterales bacterium]
QAETISLVGEQTYRVWRLYMAGSAHAFASGRIQVIQALFSKPHADGSSDIPLSRADIYSDENRRHETMEEPERRVPQ